jgi:hypothetical protein
MKRFSSNLGALVAVAAVSLISSAAFAAAPAAPEVTDIVGYLTGLLVPIAAVAGGVLIIVACVFGFKAIRRAL